jgi:hypothetical protein
MADVAVLHNDDLGPSRGIVCCLSIDSTGLGRLAVGIGLVGTSRSPRRGTLAVDGVLGSSTAGLDFKLMGSMMHKSSVLVLACDRQPSRECVVKVLAKQITRKGWQSAADRRVCAVRSLVQLRTERYCSPCSCSCRNRECSTV